VALLYFSLVVGDSDPNADLKSAVFNTDQCGRLEDTEGDDAWAGGEWMS
jgi:hypothetical protein